MNATPSPARLRALPRAMGWLPFTTFMLTILGLADSAYQAYADLSGTGLVGCSARADPCVLDQHSPQAYVFGIPVAVLGVVFYAFMVAICSPQAWRSPLLAVRRARLAAVIVGIGFVLYLIYVELVELGHICPYCTSVHVITFVLFSLIVFQASAPGARSAAGTGAAAPGAQHPGSARGRPARRPADG
jgi:uncharacterized membrane protein